MIQARIETRLTLHQSDNLPQSYSNLSLLYTHVSYHNDTIIKTHAGITDAMIKPQEDFFNNIFTSHFICKVSKRLFKVYVWEGAGDRTYLKYFDPEVMAVSVVSFSFSMAAQPEHWSPLCWVLAFLTTSRLSQPLTFSPQLNCLLQFNSSALYYLQTPTWWYGHASTPPQFLPISGDRNVSLPLAWNGLCDRHRAEITVMQFRGHSLPVRQSMRV